MKSRDVLLPPRLDRADAAKLVTLAERFESRLMLEQGQRLANLKSTLGLLSLASGPDRAVRLIAEGPDEDAAIAALAPLFPDA